MSPPRRGLLSMVLDPQPGPLSLDEIGSPTEWDVACVLAFLLNLAVFRGEPWFVRARPVEVPGQGIKVEVVVRWLSPEVREKVPARENGCVIDVVLEGMSGDVHAIH